MGVQWQGKSEKGDGKVSPRSGPEGGENWTQPREAAAESSAAVAVPQAAWHSADGRADEADARRGRGSA